MIMRFEISNKTLLPEKIRASLLSPHSGGYCSFEGWVRNHHEGRSVDSLEYTSYTELANKEGNRIIEKALELFDVEDIRCHHRVGHLAIGDMAVYVGAASAHRDAAFKACRYVIDEIKHTVPIWKKEHYTDKSTAWPSCKACAEGHQHDNGHSHSDSQH